MGEFLTKEEATAYFEDQCENKHLAKSFKDLNIVKVYAGKRFILFKRTAPDDYEVGGVLTISSIEMDEDGMFVDAHLSGVEESYEIDYIPTQINCLDEAVFLSVPSRVTVERTLKRTLTGVEEGVSAALLVKHKHSPMFDNIGTLQMLGEVEFIKKFGDGVGREMLSEFWETV